MVSRSPEEDHRAATPLELFFDLCFVVAVALVAASLHHALAEDDIADGVLSYMMVFFAIWWAWMNFTWFASAYDTDDALYRLTTLVQIAGALILAAGVPRAFDRDDFEIVTFGYVIMRLAMVTQWLRAAHGDVAGRQSALHFAFGIALVQAAWVARLALPDSWLIPGFAVLVLAELAVPLWAERAEPTHWHPHHIAERYGLFTLIVLGESVLATTTAVQSALDTGHGSVSLLALAGASLVIVFSMWWLYFAQPAHELLTSLRAAFVWGYGHLIIFASVAAVGAGLQVAVDFETGATELSRTAANLAVAVPVATYLLSVWALQVSRRHEGLISASYPVGAAIVLVIAAINLPLFVIAMAPAALVAVTQLTATRDSASAA